jgi:quercetin dioxygenase-like cupin family protein
MAYRVIIPNAFEWTTRPREPGEPARHVAELAYRLGASHTCANVWRYEPGARGKRHVHAEQEETFVVLAGTLTMYLGEPPERNEVPEGGVVHVEAGTPLQTANHADVDLVVFAYGSPPDHGAELLDAAV